MSLVVEHCAGCGAPFVTEPLPPDAEVLAQWPEHLGRWLCTECSGHFACFFVTLSSDETSARTFTYKGETRLVLTVRKNRDARQVLAHQLRALATMLEENGNDRNDKAGARPRRTVRG
jgi:hypothetical protein